MTSIPQDTDIFAGNAPAITVTDNDQTWTIGKGVLVKSNSDGFFSGFRNTSLINNGSVLSGSETGAGVQLNGANSFVSNLAGARIIGAFDGIVVNGATANINNQGTIQGLVDDGVKFGFSSADYALTNTGSIFGRFDGIRTLSENSGGIIHNFGTIASDDDGIFVVTRANLVTVITNAAHGTIRGSDSSISVPVGRISLDNRGTLIGDIKIGVSDGNLIVNHGAIKGSVFLGLGNDLFKGTGGTSGGVHGDKGNDTLIGGSQGDGLFGDFGQDKLTGAAGNDRLHGGFGNDTLTGGAGSDQFFFDSGLDKTLNVDKIADFTVNVDKIVLDDDVFTHLGADGVLAAARFHVGAAAADANDRIVYNQNTGFLFYDADGKGGSAGVHFATLAPHLALHNTDFVVVA